MDHATIVYYLLLIMSVGWAGWLLVEASNDLCKIAERDYPSRSDDDGRAD